MPATEDQINDNDLDLLVLNTCAVRENAAERMYGTIGRFNRVKLVRPNLQIAVGGCMAQLDRKKIADTAPWVPRCSVPRTSKICPSCWIRIVRPARRRSRSLNNCGSSRAQLPAARASRISSWVAISVGCNNTCTFCIVPTTRGKEKDRRPGDILDEIRQCVADGAKEVTLLGQNVNSFGYGIGDRYAFSKLLRACGTIDGLERVRFTSPHPAAFTDDVIAAMAETPEHHAPAALPAAVRLRPHPARDAPLLPLRQVPRHTGPHPRRHARRADFHRHHRRLPRRNRRGLPADHGRGAPGALLLGVHVHLLATPRHAAAAMEQIPRDVVQDRFDRLVALQEQITEENLATFEGRDVEVMITGKLGKKDTDTHRVTGREKTGVLVHIGVPEGEPVPEIGDFVTATVTHAGRHNLLADPDVAAGQTYSVRH